ncbi:MAG TPA: glycosyltransferase family 4 protein [Chroococcidiopsis sp.]
MRLLIISPSTRRGGAEEYLLTIASAVIQLGWELHIAFPKNPDTDSLIKDCEYTGARYHTLLLTDDENHSMLTAISEWRRTLFLALRVKPDIALINLPWPKFGFGSILACSTFNIPTALIFHLVPSTILLNARRIRAYAWARSHWQKWITISEHNRKLLSNFFKVPIHDIQCIRNGVNLEAKNLDIVIGEKYSLRERIRQELGLDSHCQIALTVGRLNAQKGYEDLIPVVQKLKEDFPNLTFVWVGEGEQREQLIAHVQALGIEKEVLFLGYRSDVATLMRASDFLVLPSHFEGQPFVLLEAMANSLPIVSSDAGGIPEMIQQGVHCQMFPVGDRDALEQSIRWALEHPEEMQKFAENGRSHLQNFSQDRMIRETLNALKKLHAHLS